MNLKIIEQLPLREYASAQFGFFSIVLSNIYIASKKFPKLVSDIA